MSICGEMLICQYVILCYLLHLSPWMLIVRPPGKCLSLIQVWHCEQLVLKCFLIHVLIPHELKRYLRTTANSHQSNQSDQPKTQPWFGADVKRRLGIVVLVSTNPSESLGSIIVEYEHIVEHEHSERDNQCD